jgi:hypothetical protein
MKTTRLLSILILSTLLLTACGVAAMRSSEQVSMEPAFAPAPAQDYAFGASGEVLSSDINRSLGQTQAGSDGERLVIRNANLTLVVQDPAQRASEIAQMAEGMDGFVVSSNVYQSSFGQGVLATQASITVRIPAENLDQALEQIKAGAVEVRSENISGQDVTQEYTDLQSQLRNLEAAEVELREIMASTTKADDVLRVFESLRQVRQEIEVTKGRIQYFEQSARLSAVSVDLLPDVVSQPLKIGRWQPEGTAKDAVQALINVLRFLADALIVIVILVVPVVFLLLIPVWILRRLILRRRARRAASSPKE